MGAMMEVVGIDTVGEFFAPTSTDMLDGLLGQYRTTRTKIEQVAALFAGDLGNVVHYFVEGNKDRDRYASLSAERVFRAEGAIAALNSAYWSKTLALTDILDSMPQKRRDEWHKSIEERTTPEFTEEAVRPTIQDLLASRGKFMAERVDGIFRSLSGEHVTNSPAGFTKRMIIGYVLNDFWISNYSRCGQINDLRAVIAKFMGRDEPQYSASSRLIDTLKGHWGEWVTVDGGALRIRLYKKGTAHMEVHPDMAWRLNSILATLYPMAIPAQFRTKPPKRVKEFTMMARPLPFQVLEILAHARPRRGDRSIRLSTSERASVALDEARRVLENIGGVHDGRFDYSFDYDPGTVIDEIVTSGCIPDQKSHQYYPTPEAVAKAAIELADIGPAHTCLEPSAGQGGLAEFMPKDRTQCVEISGLHCKILEMRGFKVDRADFLEWAKTAPKFDRIVMNPPFSEGRAAAHVGVAAGLVAQGGRIVAVLPASARNKFALPGFNLTWSREYAGEFAGTSVSVVILCAQQEIAE